MWKDGKDKTLGKLIATKQMKDKKSGKQHKRTR